MALKAMSQNRQLQPAIVRALIHDGPALVEVGQSLLKAVLNGRGDEVLDLARVNLLR
jgi:hypothetical protein